MISAHASLEQAIPATTSGAPELIRPSLIRLVGRIRAQVPLQRALRMMATEFDDPSAGLVIMTLILNVRRRGNRLAEVLTGLATSAREELEMRRCITAERAQLRRGAEAGHAFGRGVGQHASREAIAACPRWVVKLINEAAGAAPCRPRRHVHLACGAKPGVPVDTHRRSPPARTV